MIGKRIQTPSVGTKQMRVLVCGGRDFNDAQRVFAVLDHYHAQRPFSVVIHGAARGADTLAADWGRQRGIMTLAFPVPAADWEKYGKAAGSIRNAQMLREGEPDLVIAFPGDRGTADMCKQAGGDCIPVLKIPA